jgi:predicted metal-dependent enzyme (double-stranded beta helix superfamily)
MQAILRQEGRNLLVTADGSCTAITPSWERPIRPYRLYHLLSDVDKVIEENIDPWEVMLQLFPLVRRLVCQSNWVDPVCLELLEDEPWTVHTLFDSPGYPLTVHSAVWSAGQSFPPHNHAGWGIVALLSGCEENIVWKRLDHSLLAGSAELEERIRFTLHPGDIVAFDPQTIHSVQALGSLPTTTFNLYGPADYATRLEYDLEARTATQF